MTQKREPIRVDPKTQPDTKNAKSKIESFNTNYTNPKFIKPKKMKAQPESMMASFDTSFVRIPKDLKPAT